MLCRVLDCLMDAARWIKYAGKILNDLTSVSLLVNTPGVYKSISSHANGHNCNINTVPTNSYSTYYVSVNLVPQWLSSGDDIHFNTEM